MSTQTEATEAARAVERPVNPGRQRAAQPSTRVETQVWTGRPSQIANLGAFVWCALLCWLVIPIFVAVWRYLLVRTMRYELTTQRFRVTSGVLARRTDELELYRCKDSEFSQTCSSACSDSPRSRWLRRTSPRRSRLSRASRRTGRGSCAKRSATLSRTCAIGSGSEKSTTLEVASAAPRERSLTSSASLECADGGSSGGEQLWGHQRLRG
ncbi:MAG: PH domain-containing protein [Planctomycetes bacterium]|nr:PH domain-containing protein [Planctomycetota bacterium]